MGSARWGPVRFWAEDCDKGNEWAVGLRSSARAKASEAGTLGSAALIPQIAPESPRGSESLRMTLVLKGLVSP